MKTLNVLIVDGQGGGIGRQLVEEIKSSRLPCRVTAVGTNTAATAAMLKAGADQGATGENAVAVQVRDADVVTGPVGIAVADSLMGEVTPRMAQAVAQCGAELLLIPTNRCRISVVGVKDMTMEQLAEEAVERIRALANA